MIGRRALLAAGLMLALGAASGANAQSYPAKPVRLLVPFPAAGPAEVMSRIVGNNQAGNLITEITRQELNHVTPRNITIHISLPYKPLPKNLHGRVLSTVPQILYYQIHVSTQDDP